MPPRVLSKKAAKELLSPEDLEFAETLADIKKHKGHGAVVKGRGIPACNRIPTGAFTLDYALMGGIPEGHGTTLYGLKSSGKTTLAKCITANVLKKYPDGEAIWIDTEGLYDPDWFETLGGDNNRINVSRPESGNEAVDLIDALMKPKKVKILVLDSIADLVANQIIERSAEDLTRGVNAALCGVMCSKIYVNWAISRKQGHFVTVLFLNQLRDNQDAMSKVKYRLPGGKQVQHLPSTMIELKNYETTDKGSKDAFGNDLISRNVHNFKLTKTKHGVAIKEGEYQMSINPDTNDGVPLGGFINHKTVTAFAKKMGLISGGGSGGFRVAGIDRPFRILDDIATYLLGNPAECLRLQQLMIAMFRADKNTSPLPPDGYLLGWNARESASVVLGSSSRSISRAPSKPARVIKRG